MPIRTEAGWKLTYEDYAKIPEDGRRHEIIDGDHVVNPAPTTNHQRVSARLHLALAALGKDGRAEVFYAPIDVQLSETDIVQPDLIAIAAGSSSILGRIKVEGAPDLVIEILSPSTRRLDLGAKRDLYERAGVREYWVVDAEGETLLQHVLVEGRYREQAQTEGLLASTAFPGFELDVRALFEPLHLG